MHMLESSFLLIKFNVTAPDASTDKPSPAPTSDPGPKDTPNLPDYKWYWNHGEDSIFAQDSDVFKNFKPSDTDQTLDTHTTPLISKSVV
ncbi:unnamed protein product [Peronospora destructor]|uniref:Uncharacterized protein n=1 Tax=Peronospora destructor TaxID=86335 RepID=A0AAV0V7B2_9STRA|nr:unnamed protein product [Peronospora destructor]